MDAGQGLPRDGVGEEEVAEDSGHVAQLSNLKPVHRGVAVGENVLEWLHVHLVHLAQSAQVKGDTNRSKLCLKKTFQKIE